MLLSSGGFAVYHAEARAYDLIGPRFWDLRSKRARQDFLDQWTQGFMFARSDLDEATIRERVLENCANTSDFLRILMEEIAEKQGVNRWAECTPMNALYLRRILKDFPTAHVVHIIRDGRDVALSMARQGWIGRLPLDRASEAVASAIYWEWIVKKGSRDGQLLGKRYTEVRFEELIARPDEVLSKLGEAINHELTFEQILRNGIGSVRRPNTSFGSERNFSPVGRWHDADAELKQALNAHIGNFLTELGYAPTDPVPVSWSAQVRKYLYTTFFQSKQFLRNRIVLGRYLISDPLLTQARP